MAEKTYILPRGRSTDTSALQLNQILIVSSGPRQRYSLSYKLIRSLLQDKEMIFILTALLFY